MIGVGVTTPQAWDDAGRGRAVFEVGRDGKIKAPGPFGSMVLMVLRNFRDLSGRLGPGLRAFFHLFSVLSGTFLSVDDHV